MLARRRVPQQAYSSIRFPSDLGSSSPKYLAWLRHLNARDCDIYLCVNPIRPGSRGREKSDIAEVRRLQLDLDEDGPTGYARVLQDVERGALPRPAHILRSSKDRYQFLWDMVPDQWSQGQAEPVMRGLADRYGGDRGATEVARVMRLPGFRNCKPGRARSLVTWTCYPDPLLRMRLERRNGAVDWLSFRLQ